MSQLERQQQILEVLCQRRHDTYSNLAQEFQVSKRTIIRDIQTLMLSYPIHAVPGRYGGGVWVEEGFYLYRNFLSKSEKAVLKKVADMSPLDNDDIEIVKAIIVRSSF